MNWSCVFYVSSLKLISLYYVINFYQLQANEKDISDIKQMVVSSINKTPNDK